jgi:iron complex outermembrane receptor protein
MNKTTKNKTRNFKKNQLALIINMALVGTLSSTLTYAEELKDNEAKTKVEVIQVTGIRTSVIAGLDLKRNSSSIVDAVSAEDMGKFPDANLAEALQRIPDVAIDRDGGEGRKVTIRGLGPEFNQVLLNGRKVASSEATRSFSFDTIASELVSEMVVYKTQSAGLSEGSIGGTIDVKTARPLNYDGLNISGTVQGTYEGNSEETNPQGSFLISNTFMNDTVGALFGATYQQRNNTTYSTNVQSIRTEGAFLTPAPNYYSNDGFDPVYRPTELNRDVTNDSRERLGLNGVLQYQPNDKLNVTVDFLYSKFDVKSEVNRKSNWLWNSLSPNSSNTEIDANGVVTTLDHALTDFWGQSATAFNRRDVHRETKTKMMGINFDYMINDDMKLIVDAAWSTAVDDNKGKDKRRSTELFISEADAIANDSVFQIDLSQDVPSIENIDAWSANNPNMARDLKVRQQWNEGNDIEATNYELSADLVIASFEDITITTGFAYEVSEKSNVDYRTPNDVQTLYHKNNYNFPAGAYDTAVSGIIDVDSTDLGQPSATDNDLLNFNVPGFDSMLNNPANALAAVGGDVSNPAYQAFLANGSSFNAVQTGNSFEVEETITSFYVEGEYDFMLGDMDATLIAGVRYTQTDLESIGYSQILSDLTKVTCDGNGTDNCLEPTYASSDGPDGLTQDTLSNSYSDVLPSATLNLNLTDDVVLRLASSKSMTRPYLEDMAPKFRVGTLTTDIRTAESNNERLTPYTSFNLDASLEWYFNEGSLVSVALYSKTIDDFIIKQTIDNVTVDSVSTPEYQDFSVTQPTNGDEVEVTGATFNLTQTFESGFGYQFNYTLTDTDTEFDPNTFDSTKPVLPGLGDSMNLVAFYESGPFAARIAYNKRDEFIRTAQYSSGFGYGEAFEEPVFAAEYDQVDARVSYEVAEGVTVFVDGINLTGSELKQHGRYDNLFVSYENFGTRYTVGVSAKF